MSDSIIDIFTFPFDFTSDKGPSKEEKAAKRLQSAKEQEVRRRESRENRRRASTAKTLTASQRGGSLFPSDFASSGSTTLG